MNGVVKRYFPAKGYGFIACEAMSKDYLFLICECAGGYYPVCGDNVSFELTERDGRERASKVQRLTR